MEKLESIGGIMDLIRKKDTPVVSGQEYLLGLRGFLVFQSFLWTFLIVFAPNTVKDATISTDGPLWQIVLRKTFSVLFWNGTLIYSFFIILSARNLAIPFFHAPSKSIMALAIFRRGIRLAIPVAVSLAIITIAFNVADVAYTTSHDVAHVSVAEVVYIDEFKTFTNNTAIDTPRVLQNTFIYFNSVFQLFWHTNDLFTQSGNFAFPSSTLWLINLIYQQSFTVFIIMVIAPYTRAEWRVKMAVPFLITAWWVQSWAWYSVSGLFLADLVMNMDFKAKAQRGIPLPYVNNFRLPSWIPTLIIMTAGLVMQYLWTAWRPDMLNDEISAHTGLYYGGQLNADVDVRQPQARDDNYLFVMGFLILLETFDFMQKAFNNPVFVYLGKRSLSWFLTQSWIIYIVGIKVFMRLNRNGTSTDTANVACLVITLLTTIITSEAFYRTVDYPANAFSRYAFEWICQ